MSHFCLKWNNHVSNMLTMFESLKSMDNFVDVTLACEGRLIKAHKLILSAGSKFFHNLFITNPCKHPIIVMHDIKYNVLKAIIEFMYKGEISVTHEHLQVLLKTAKTLDVKGLAEIWKDSNRTENQDSQETSHPSTTMSSMTMPPESPLPSHKKKRIRLRKRSFDSTFSNDEIVPKIEECTSPESQEPIDFVSNIGDSTNLLPNNILTIPRPIKRLMSSSSKPVSVPVCEELEIDPVTDHDYNVESFKEEQTSLTSEQVETSSKHSGEPVIHNISSSESVPISVVPPSDTLSSVQILDQNDSEDCDIVDVKPSFVQQATICSQVTDASEEYLTENDLCSVFQRCRNPCQFAVNVARMLFSPDELRESNCRGVKDKSALDRKRLEFIRSSVMKYYNVLPIYEIDIWKQCMQSIDSRCRHERRPKFKNTIISFGFSDES